MCCAMNGAGTILATAAVDRSVCLWQLSSPITASWNLLKVFSLAHRQDIHSLAFAPRIRCREILSSTSADKTVKLWSVFLHDTELVRGTVHPRRVHGGCQAILSGHKAAVAAFAFQNILVKSAIEPTLCEDSPALSDATEFPEDAPSVEETSSMDESSSDEHTEEFSHTFASDETIRQDGDVLLSSAAGSMIKIWLYKGFDRCEIRLPAKPELLPCIATLSGHQGSIAALQFSAVSATDHKHDAARFLFSCGREDQSIRIWQVASFPFTCLYQWTAHKAFVTDMCIAGLNDHLMTSSLDKSLKVWDLRIILNQLAASSSDPGTGVPFQRELSTTATTTATMMTTTNGAHHAMGTSLSSSSSSSSESHGQQFGVADDEHRSTITCITVSPDGRFMLSASLDQQLRLWNLSTHNLLRVFDHPHQEEEAGGANESTNATIPIISILHFCYCSDWEEANYRSTSISLDEVYFVSAIWQNNGRFKLWNGAQHHRCLRVIQAFVPLSSQTVESPTGLGWSVPSSIRDIAMDFNDGHLWTVSYDGRIKFWAVDALITASESTYIPSSASNSGDADVFCGMVLDSSAASDGAKLADGKGMKRKVGKQESGGASSSTSFPSEADTEGCLGEIMDYYVGGSSTGHLVSAVAFADGDNDEDDDDDDDDDAAATNSPSECFESPPTSPGFHADVSTARCGGRHRRRRRRRRRPSLLAIAQESGCIHLVHTGTKKCVRRLTTRCHSKNPSTETWHDFPPPPATAIASSPSDVVVVETPGPVMNAGQRKASSSAATATATRPVSVDVPFVTTGNMNNLRDIHPANHHHQGHQHVSSVHVFTRPNEPNVTVVASGMMHQSDYSGGGGGDGGGGGIPIGSVIWIWYDVDVTSSSSSSSSSLLSLSLSTSSSVSEPPSQTRKARRKEKQQQQRQQRGSSRKVGGGHDRHYDVIVAPHRVFHWQRFLQQLRRSPSAPSERAADRWSGVRLEKKDILRQVRVLSREAWSVAAITSGGEVFVVDVGALPTRRDVEQQAAATAATAAAVQESYYAVIRTRFTLYDDWVTCIVGNVPDGKIAGMMAGGTTSSVLVGTRNGAILTTES